MVAAEHQSPVARVVEAVVSAIIVLVVVQTFLEDLAVLAEWSTDVRTGLLLAGFLFDLFFTVEFVSRFYFSLVRGRAGRYIVYERGWIDFLASIPLLMFSSGPPVLAMFLGVGGAASAGGILNMLKLVKAIRIARILRLLRILKIFKNIKYAESPMAQRHVAKVITIAITALVFSLFAYSTLGRWVPALRAGQEYRLNNDRLMNQIKGSGASNETIRALHVLDEPAMIVQKGSRILYSRYDGAYYQTHFARGDFEVRQDGELVVTFDMRAASAAIDRAQSQQNLFFFCIVVISVLAYLVLYSAHFALTVSDPLHVMRRGMSEASYNLEVRIPEAFESDDIFQLARLFNEEYLPLKDLNSQETERTGSDLTMENLGDILQS